MDIRGGKLCTQIFTQSKQETISRQSYLAKKRRGGFKLNEAMKLMSMYNASCEYLFSAEAGTETYTQPGSDPLTPNRPAAQRAAAY